MTSHDALLNMVKDAATRLGEHCTAVQILASMPAAGGGTANVMSGAGDWYARIGLAHAFIRRDQVQEFAHGTNDAGGLNVNMEEVEDGNEWKHN